MAKVFKQLKELDGLINALIAEQQLLKKEVINSRGEIQRLEHENQGLRQELELAKDEVRDLKLARGLVGSEPEADLARARIQSLMREIDRCIALLNE